MNKLLKIISQFKNAKILVLGDVILDEFIWGAVDRISPEAPVPVVKVNSQSFMPGGASNVANNARALGAKVYIAGVVGNDQYGNILSRQLEDKGINVDGLMVDEGRPTTLKTRVIAHSQQVVRIDREDEAHIGSGILKRILLYVKAKIKDVDAILIEDYGKGVIMPKLLSGILNLAKSGKKIITVDPKEEHFSYYKMVTAITPNKHELEKASGIKIKDMPQLEKAAFKLLKRLKLSSILVTLGEGGMRLFEKNGKISRIPTMAQEVFDVSGAGDTVISAFTLSIASGATHEEAAFISNCAAGVVVGKVGVAVCAQSELRKKIISEGKK
ncbi:MAG: D-glycero-beta-D-manno-heptose-7-phosphate kinase [Candidatus Omnitrophica bacterium]|nr:D-glycero-beta-D-manno-heptose-7-phosphate kinase [Candidatus Omnitrophota bacterium]